VNTKGTADVRDAQRKHWNNVAGGWAKRLAWTARAFAPLTPWLHRAAGWAPGARLLDVASGAGYPALAAAAAVHPGGTVAAADVSARMVAALRHSAEAAGLDNLGCVEMDAEALGFADASFDAVTCVCGLMFCAEPGRAIAEMQRVLKAGGRFAIAVWDDPSLNPFSAVIVDVVSRYVPLPPLHDVDAPGPFRFSAPGALEGLLRDAEFTDITVESRALAFEHESAADYLETFADFAGWSRKLDALPAAAASSLRTALEGAVRPYVRADRIRLPATLRCAAGRRAS
jgi:SAM-dependent methyltransferase